MNFKDQLIIKDTETLLAKEAAEIFVRTAHECVVQKGRFTVALSGGTTPRRLYRLLAKEPYRLNIPWDKMDIFWVDERCLPSSDAASNYGTAKKDMLDHVPLVSSGIHPMPGDLDPEQGAAEYEEELIAHFELKKGVLPSFDLMFLGMGRDGHTASLFPGHKALKEQEKRVMAVKGGNPDVNRLTMTFPVINRTRLIVFLISGQEKAEMVRTVIEGGQRLLPAQKVRPVNGRLMWLMTLDAASLIAEATLTSMK